MRAFLAVTPDPDSRDYLCRLLDNLAASTTAEGLRWSIPENLHLTLCFLGDISQQQAGLLIDSSRNSLSRYTPFRLQPLGFTVLPGNRPRLLALEYQRTAELLKLVGFLRRQASRLGIRLQRQRLLPHITLCRFQTPPQVWPTADTVTGQPLLRIKSIELFQSILHVSGVRYTALDKIQLSGNSIVLPTD